MTNLTSATSLSVAQGASSLSGAWSARSLRGRLSRQFALQTLLGLSVVCSAVYLVIAFTLASRQDEALQKKQAAVQRLLNEARELHDIPGIKHLLNDFLAGHDDLSLIVRQRDSHLVFEKDASDRREAMSKRVAFEVKLPDELGGTGRAELIQDTRRDEAVLSRLLWTLVSAAIGGTFAVSVSGFRLVKQGLDPLNALAATTAGLDASRMDQRLEATGQPEEVVPLLQQFNALLDRLQTAHAQMEAFNTDVAHELNNPLSILIGTCEVALRRPRPVAELSEVLSSNLEELQRIAGIVSDMLFLSNAEHGASARRSQETCLSVIVEEVVDYYEAVFEEAGLRVEIRGDALVPVDIGLVRRAVSNLLSNAARYATRNSVISVWIGRAGRHHFSIGVHNEGPVIGPEHLPRLFDRFYRTDQSRTNADRNHGLGLAIVAAIARMHGGAAEVASSERGTLVQFTIKRPDPGDPAAAPRETSGQGSSHVRTTDGEQR
jgi:two-component system heavy metal sensor histidine kinase CusS